MTEAPNESMKKNRKYQIRCFFGRKNTASCQRLNNKLDDNEVSKVRFGKFATQINERWNVRQDQNKSKRQV